MPKANDPVTWTQFGIFISAALAILGSAYFLLRSDLTDFKGTTHTDLATLTTQTHTDLTALTTQMHTDFVTLTNQVSAIREQGAVTNAKVDGIQKTIDKKFKP
jgi:hypothetical protein